MDKQIQAKFQEWKSKVTDEALIKDLNSLTDKDIEDRFFKELSFGTGGLRGVIGAGSNCMNIYTVRKATKGIANYLNAHDAKSVAISYDSRINSDLFAQCSAEVFAAAGIKVYLVKELMPTPFASYCVRELGCDMGAMITASHNPAIYNGYKVYNGAGCQITDVVADDISNAIADVDAFEVVSDSFESYLQSGMIEYVSDAVEDKYLECVKSQNINNVENLKITYSALNGTGYRIIPKLLQSYGIDLELVKEQCVPDGNFPTCKFPNPEKQEALQLGLDYCAKNGADLLLATDPDADRVGIAVKTGDEYKLLSGNEVGVLLTDYVLKARTETGKMPANPLIVKTIVTTDLVCKVAAPYNAIVKDVLTGFKYIGEMIGEMEQEGKEDNFVLGFEESYGYLTGSAVRDKDAVVASAMIVEMASYYKKQGITLVDKINEIYAEHGHYENFLYNFEFLGKDGFDAMGKIMAALRKANISEVMGQKVVKMVDYENQDILPKSDVLEYNLANGVKFTVRPSGTEPKLKIYLFLSFTHEQNVEAKKEYDKYFDSIIKA